MTGATKVVEFPLLLEVPVGPQHPALHEPLMLKVYADGEEVVKVEVNTGYNHRGIEKLSERNDFYKVIFIAGRVCGICNTVHADCCTRALEAILGIDPQPRAKYLRVLAMELERIHSHMLINAIMAEVIGYDTLFMYIMRDRELIMKAKEILTGGRVIADYMMVGGVRRDLDEVKRDRLKEILKKVRPRLKYYIKVFETDATIGKRLTGVGVLKPIDVIKHSLLGPTLRGSGLPIDSRDYDRYDAYGDVPLQVITRREGDSLARMMVRWEEALVSHEMCEYVLEHLPQGDAVPNEKRLPRRFPEGEAYTTVEAPRGELTYYILSKGGNKPYRVKIRTPSFNNIINSAFSYIGYTIADVPVILVSYDPCIACMERATVIDLEKGVRKRVPLKELARGAA
mgnify:CR=1 FL=1